MTARKRRVAPVPEVVAPEVRWTVRESDAAAHCSRAAGVFAVPQDGSPFARAVTVHELAHVRWSPPRPNPKRLKVSPGALLACEDARVNALVAWKVPGAAAWYPAMLVDPPGVPPVADRIGGLVRAGHVKDAALLTVAAWMTEEFGPLLALLPEDAARHVRRAVGLIERRAWSKGARTLPFRNTVKAARYLDAAFAPPPCEPGDQLPPADLAAEWSPMTVATPPRPVATTPRVAAHRWLARDTGAVIRRPDRYYVDGSPFGLRVVTKQKGGVLIVDGSSSMSFEPGDLDRVLTQAPAATVAIYSERGTRATLTVLADGGRRVRDLTCLDGAGCGNGCDAAALQWGAAKPGPRVWLSDGEVCSRRGTNMRMIRDVEAHHAAGAYRRAVTVTEALAALAGTAIPARPAVHPGVRANVASRTAAR